MGDDSSGGVGYVWDVVEGCCGVVVSEISNLMPGVDLSGSVWDSMPSMSKDVVLVVADSWCGDSCGVVLDCSSSMMGKRS